MSNAHGLFYTPAWPTCPVCGVSMRPDTFEFHKIEQCAKWTRQRYAAPVPGVKR